MTNLISTVRFFWEGLLNQPQMGAILPSQRFLVSRMIQPVPGNFRGRVLELGAGTGALTVRLARKCPKADLVSCEINPHLARETERMLARQGLSRRVRVVAAPAEDILPEMGAAGDLQFVISGIPLAHLDREKTLALIDAIHKALKPGGIYIQFQHSLLDRKNISRRFARMRILPVFLNFPPAVVYYAQK